ncbi:hypothetical protein [Acidiplasma sp.]|uniref:hypothetical protein n=1 Tax=Acidiplasma sp. TaxID=1872114 RepID=UPI0025901197|nr:hypothetical protein [Acidiplasma sp.]
MNKKMIIICLLMVVALVTLVFMPSLTITQSPINNKANAEGVEACCGGPYTWSDIFGKVVVKGSFCASWTYSQSNGNYIHGYAPVSTAHAVVPYVSWIHVHTPGWKSPKANKWIAVGNVGYHIGIWDISMEQHYHATVTVKPNSYGDGSRGLALGECKI